ncbi:hypothetical protein RIF29_18649 [Crotalaria pallida]|uniref:Uncharacterized protein n=1 Tax=Crotalaria pallida TaxID=3830 RepID=A0AAN9F2J8_CROPI
MHNKNPTLPSFGVECLCDVSQPPTSFLQPPLLNHKEKGEAVERDSDVIDNGVGLTINGIDLPKVACGLTKNASTNWK